MNRTAAFLSIALSVSCAVWAQPGPGMGPMHGPGMGPMGGPGGGMGFGQMAGPGFRAVVTGAPYSGVETMQFQEKLSDGNVISRSSQTKVYRDGQGRLRMEHTGTPPGSTTTQTHIGIFDPVAGYMYVLDPATKTAIRHQLPPQRTNTGTATKPASPPQPRNGATVNKEDLGTQTVNGVSATGTRTTITVPAGAIGNQAPIVSTREVWIATTLKVPVLIKSTDPRFGNSTTELTNIVTAEPDVALFQVPAGYTTTDRGRGGAGMGHGPKGGMHYMPGGGQ